MVDVVIIGGGVIGLSTALELARQDLTVRILERAQFGSEASWAGAGMLPPGGPNPSANLHSQLRAASAALWPKWAAQLFEETAIDAGYRICGCLELSPSASSHAAFSEGIQNWQAEGVRLEIGGNGELSNRSRQLNLSDMDSYWLPDYAQVRNPRLIKALVSACASRGVVLSPGTPVIDFVSDADRIDAVRTDSEIVTAGQFVLAAGAWSDSVAKYLNLNFQIKPVRGQMVLLDQLPLPFRCIIQCGRKYLVPRPDGQILVGATEEDAGFVKLNTPHAVADLLQFAQRIVPSLQTARFERCWAGFRPHRAAGIPYIGRVPQWRNLFASVGHFRDGLQLSPISAVLIREQILGTTPSIPIPSEAHGECFDNPKN